jgi:hypothetical protein
MIFEQCSAREGPQLERFGTNVAKLPDSDFRRSRSSSRGLGRSVDLLGRGDLGLAEALALDQRLHGLSVRVDALP